MKAKQIIDDSDWSTESEEKWEAVRESLLETIDKKQAIDEGKIAVNYSKEDLVGLDYADVKKKLEKQGFINIQLEPVGDLITGWITKDGEVEEVTINGGTDYKETSYYSPEVEIVIIYHTYQQCKLLGCPLKKIGEVRVAKMQQAYHKAETSLPGNLLFMELQRMYFDKLKELKMKV